MILSKASVFTKSSWVNEQLLKAYLYWNNRNSFCTYSASNWYYPKPHYLRRVHESMNNYFKPIFIGIIGIAFTPAVQVINIVRSLKIHWPLHSFCPFFFKKSKGNFEFFYGARLLVKRARWMGGSFLFFWRASRKEGDQFFWGGGYDRYRNHAASINFYEKLKDF